jgi:hypothetical protein
LLRASGRSPSSDSKDVLHRPSSRSSNSSSLVIRMASACDFPAPPL